MSCPFSVGTGFDVHRLAVGYPLHICGVEIPYEMGLEAHSDGDVALHALCDALLGAAALAILATTSRLATIVTRG